MECNYKKHKNNMLSQERIDFESYLYGTYFGNKIIRDKKLRRKSIYELNKIALDRAKEIQEKHFSKFENHVAINVYRFFEGYKEIMEDYICHDIKVNKIAKYFLKKKIDKIGNFLNEITLRKDDDYGKQDI